VPAENIVAINIAYDLKNSDVPLPSFKLKEFARC